MATYSIEPTTATLHGCFSHELPPVLTIDPGDNVRFKTLDADWIIEFTATLEQNPETTADLGVRYSPQLPVRDEGHALCGPVAVRGAKPGMALAVQINKVVPGRWGWGLPWFGAVVKSKKEVPVMVWSLDTVAMTARNQFGHTVALRPFMGVMGLALAEPGMHSTSPPRRVGGNMDCKELVAGSTLYLPIEVEGGLFSTGDGHGVQGDGESGGTAIECPMDLVDLTFDLVEQPLLPTPYANTPAGWITLGFDEDLQKAHEQALNAMVTLISQRMAISEKIALTLCGVAVDLHVTQTVNGVRGVHAILPHGAIR
ncbi:MAG TPA: acetamidase/formamidase family protein [Phototrophicaceae bacterium]|nr:acetamidase/formamidase family protein [Phototrophicaceae bacterium]